MSFKSYHKLYSPGDIVVDIVDSRRNIGILIKDASSELKQMDFDADLFLGLLYMIATRKNNWTLQENFLLGFEKIEVFAARKNNLKK